MKHLRYLSVVTFALFFASSIAVATTPGTVVHFSSLDKNQAYDLSGTLYLPDRGTAAVPAIVMVHGTSGVNVVGKFYREPILNAGIAIFEVDFKSGVFTGPTDRPHIETFLPMAFAALRELRKNPAIDPDRIGIMGFSMGGGVTMRTAIEDNRKEWIGNEKGFVAFVAFYPVSKPLVPIMERSSGLSAAPIIVFYGTEDCYGEGKSVPELKKMLKRKFNFDLATVEYLGATHDFNRNSPPMAYYDPAAIGGKGFMKFDSQAADDSLAKVVDFLRQNLAAGKPSK